jgi:hypothetical protein
MSENTNETTATANVDTNVGGRLKAKQDAKKPVKRPRQSKDSFSVSDLARARLRKRGIKSDDRLSDECKVVRGILRSNFTFVAKNDATVRKAKDAANDRKPWPTNMGKHTFEVAVNGKRTKS